MVSVGCVAGRCSTLWSRRRLDFRLCSILWASVEGASRFNEFKQAVGEIPPRTLAQRLLELEDAGLLERRVIDARPPRVEYVLTDRGRRMRNVLDALAAYAAPG